MHENSVHIPSSLEIIKKKKKSGEICLELQRVTSGCPVCLSIKSPLYKLSFNKIHSRQVVQHTCLHKLYIAIQGSLSLQNTNDHETTPVFYFIFFSSDAKPVQEINGSFSVFQSTCVQCKLFFFFNNNYSACISYSVTEKKKNHMTSSDGMGAGGQGAKGFTIMSLKSGSTFQESNQLFCCLCCWSVFIFEKTQYKNWQKPTETTDPHIEVYILLQIVVPNSVWQVVFRQPAEG